MLKNFNDSEMSEANLHTKTLSFDTVAQKYSPVIFVHWWKDIYSDHTTKPAEWPTVHISINEEERRRDRMPAYTINVQSLIASVGE